MATKVYEAINKEYMDSFKEKVEAGKTVKIVQPTIDANDSKNRAYNVIKALENVDSFNGSLEIYAKRSYIDKKTNETKEIEVKGKLYEKNPIQGKNSRELVFVSEADENNKKFEFSSKIERYSKKDIEDSKGKLSEDLLGKIKVQTVSEFLNKTIEYEKDGNKRFLSNPLKGVDILKITPVKFLDTSKEMDKNVANKLAEASSALPEGARLVRMEFTKTENGVEITAGPAKKDEIETKTQEAPEAPKVESVEANDSIENVDGIEDVDYSDADIGDMGR